MERDAAAALGLGDRELVVLRLTLLDAFADSLAELADRAGMSIDNTADAVTRLLELGLIYQRPTEDDYALRPRFEHAAWPAVAAPVGTTPIRWSGTMHARRDPQVVRGDIDKFGADWCRFRESNPDRFDAEMDEDARRAVSLLWLGASGFGEAPNLTSRLAEAAYLFSPAAWRCAARCFLDGSLRQTIGLSLADSRTLPGLPPMLIVDRQRMYCSVCGSPAAASEGRHITKIDSQLGEGLVTVTVASGAWVDELPFEPGCGVAWTHYTVRAWLAEVSELNGPDGRRRRRMKPLERLPELIWLDP